MSSSSLSSARMINLLPPLSVFSVLLIKQGFSSWDIRMVSSALGHSCGGDGELGGEIARTEEREGGQPSDVHQRDTVEEVEAAEEGRRELSRAESGHESKGSREVRGRGEARRSGG
ncbi:hypothetical protein Syun_019227 [Stephania yunnanensis]|uniref:Uncharacterized protein n=1 Tax=Stephania yunnanensis TaxID=152371 RepID=A0AAP0IUF3_9MAGN